MFDLIKNISPTELTLGLFLLTALFGAKTVGDMAKKGGETYKEVKKIKKGIIETTIEDEQS